MAKASEVEVKINIGGWPQLKKKVKSNLERIKYLERVCAHVDQELESFECIHDGSSAGMALTDLRSLLSGETKLS